MTDLPSPAAPAGEPAARRTYRFAFDVEATLAPEPGEDLAGLSPLEWEHVTLTGIYRWDLDGPSAGVAANGSRPLRGLLV